MFTKLKHILKAYLVPVNHTWCHKRSKRRSRFIHDTWLSRSKQRRSILCFTCDTPPSNFCEGSFGFLGFFFSAQEQLLSFNSLSRNALQQLPFFYEDLPPFAIVGLDRLNLLLDFIAHLIDILSFIDLLSLLVVHIHRQFLVNVVLIVDEQLIRK
jgi:hypothetical protein